MITERPLGSIVRTTWPSAAHRFRRLNTFVWFRSHCRAKLEIVVSTRLPGCASSQVSASSSVSPPSRLSMLGSRWGLDPRERASSRRRAFIVSRNDKSGARRVRSECSLSQRSRQWVTSSQVRPNSGSERYGVRLLGQRNGRMAPIVERRAKRNHRRQPS